MKTSFQFVLALMIVSVLNTVPVLAQQPCSSGKIGAAQIVQHEGKVSTLWNKLETAYESGDKKQEEDLVKQLEGYSKRREIIFSDDDKNKMEELAQRPEVKLIIEAMYTERRAADTELAHNSNVDNCFFYPNPMLQDYVNRLGQSLVPRDSTQFYAFRIVNDPRPDGWALSTGSIYVTTGLMSMLDNEAQLAYVLGHEIGHVEHRHLYARTRGEVLQRLLEVEKIKSARKKGMILGAIAASVGGALGAKEGGGSGAVLGATLGFGTSTLVTNLVAALRSPKIENDWSTPQEADADEFAAHIVLEHDFDVREAPKVFLTLENSIHRDDRVGMGFHYGMVNNLVERRQHIQALLTGALVADLERRSKTGLQSTSPNFALLMSEVKRDNGELALQYDLFDEARQNLEEAIGLRSGDPTAHLYLGRVYKLTARLPGDEQKAMDHFMQAIRLDTGRSAYPQPHLERALSLLKQNDQSVLAEAQKEIKTYIELYQLNNGGAVPPNQSAAGNTSQLDNGAGVVPSMLILYDYISLTGDTTWSQPPVINVLQSSHNVNQFEARQVEAKATEVKKPK